MQSDQMQLTLIASRLCLCHVYICKSHECEFVVYMYIKMHNIAIVQCHSSRGVEMTWLLTMCHSSYTLLAKPMPSWNFPYGYLVVVAWFPW